jgi:hypothetical protein
MKTIKNVVFYFNAFSLTLFGDGQFGFSNVKTIRSTLNINREWIYILSFSVISLELTEWSEGAVSFLRG